MFHNFSIIYSYSKFTASFSAISNEGTLGYVHLQSNPGMRHFKAPYFSKHKRHILRCHPVCSPELTLLKLSMPCNPVIFEFRQIMHKTCFVVQVNCNKKAYVQNLSTFKIQGAMQG